MQRIILTISIALCCYGPSQTAIGQKPQTDSLEVFKQLLALPAPTPRNAAPPVPDEVKRRGFDFFNFNNPPADDAPLIDLVDYWNRWAEAPSISRPTANVRERLLDAFVENPESLVRLIKALPETDAAKARVKELYDREISNPDIHVYWRSVVKDWLLYSSSYFHDELVTEAGKVKDSEEMGGVEHNASIVALAKMDWTAAEPLIRSLAASGQPRSTALALSLFYEHAVETNNASDEERYRSELKVIAANANQPGDARDTAVRILSSTEWSGRNEWYLSLFRDESLIDINDVSRVYSPLCYLFLSDTKKWVPILARLTESKDFATRSGAAGCLATMQDPGKDALEPLLPWLSNPGWATDKRDHRLRVMQNLETVAVPDSVTGLIWVVENDEQYGRSFAAQALATYKDPRAVPALKKALASEKDESHRSRIINGLLASHGLQDDEQLQALEAYATKLATDEGRLEVLSYGSTDAKPLDIPLSIGKHLAELSDAPDSLVFSVLRRADSLKESNPPLARSLLEIAHRWQGRQIDLDMLRRIGNGSADANTIVQALERREKLRAYLNAELQSLLALAGPPQAIGAVLLDEASLAHEVLTSQDRPAQIALFACARLTQTPLPLELVARLLNSKNALLSLAAERYLLAEDSAEARDLLWRRHPNEAFVAGWREQSGFIYDVAAITKAEDKLRAEPLKEGGPVEIYGLFRDEESGRVLRVYSDRAVYTYYDDAARYFERNITKGELAAFKEFFKTSGIEDWPPQFFWCHHDCPILEALSLTKEKGRRVVSQGYGGWSELTRNLDLLGEGEDVKIHYRLAQDISGLEILYTDKQLVAKDVWQRGNEVRVLIQRQLTEEDLKEESASVPKEEDDEVARTERRRMEAVREQARYSWRLLAHNNAEAVTTQPEVYTTFDDTKFPRSDDDEIRDNSKVQSVGDAIVFAREGGGLFKQLPGVKAARISAGDEAYEAPVATPDGKWLVVIKAEEEGQAYFVRFNLQTGREFRVKLEPADELQTIAFLPVHNKVLVRRAKQSELTLTQNNSADRPEYYLIDPASGETRLVTGVFEPLLDLSESERFLQATDKSTEFWAAISDDTKNRTQVGRYNLKDFSFKPWLTIPRITFRSTEMWVDAGHGKLYFVYEGHVLRLPLQPPSTEPQKTQE